MSETPKSRVVREALGEASAHERGLVGIRVRGDDTRILAACACVTLTLIQQTPAERDLGLSERMRESVLASISEVPRETSPLNVPAARQALESVAAAIDEAGSPLTIGERTLMRELLARFVSES
jgi:hypothetical protein